MKNAKIMPYLAAGGTVLFWSSAFPAVKFSLDYFSPAALMLFRFLIATAVLLTYCTIKKVPLPERKDLPMFISCGFVGLFLYMWAFNTGTDMVTSGISGFIIASAPVFTLILSIIFLKEKSGVMIWIGVLISFVGIVIIAFTQVTDLQLNAGVWLLLAAAIAASIFIIMQRQLLKKYSVMQVTAYPIAFGTLFMCIFLPNLFREIPAAPMSANLVVVYLGLFPAAIAYFLWGYALNRSEKTVYVTSFLYLSPFLTTIFAFFWLGEIMPPLAFVGGIVVIAGMIITKLKSPRKNDSKTPDMKYQLRFFFDYGSGVCIWAGNEHAQKKFESYPIESNILPISKTLKNELDCLIVEYDSSLNWDDPSNPSPWTKEQKNDFSSRADIIYVKLENELGSKYELKNEFKGCI